MAQTTAGSTNVTSDGVTIVVANMPLPDVTIQDGQPCFLSGKYYKLLYIMCVTCRAQGIINEQIFCV